MRHIYICDYHKGVIQSVRKRKKRDSDDEAGGSPDRDIDMPEVSKQGLERAQH